MEKEGLREETYKDFVVYLDDDNKQKEVFCKVLENSVDRVVFSYNSIVVTIPFTRIIKIKQRKEVQNDTKYL